MAVIIIALPTAVAHDPPLSIETFAYLTVTPNPGTAAGKIGDSDRNGGGFGRCGMALASTFYHREIFRMGR